MVSLLRCERYTKRGSVEVKTSGYGKGYSKAQAMPAQPSVHHGGYLLIKYMRFERLGFSLFLEAKLNRLS